MEFTLNSGTKMTSKTLRVQGFKLQESPRIYLASISGKWLLERTTPSWRIKDPERGFQRIVQESRARQIAMAVLDQQRTFPNSIVLATDREKFNDNEGTIDLPSDATFLVVDGQHRLWSQKFAHFEAKFACVIHVGLSEEEMARLFVEINDNQKRVPSSLRWDLVRLVRPEDDPHGIAASEIVYLLTTEEESPLFQRIDLTGEQSEIQLKQGSLAPEIKRLLSKRSPIHDLSFDQQYAIVTQFFIALRELDGDNWGSKESTFYRARILRALLRLLSDLVVQIKKFSIEISYSDFLPFLERIDESSLDLENIRAAQGNAGIKAIYDQMRVQVLS